MLRQTARCLENWRSHYHRLRVPRSIVLKRHVKREEMRHARDAARASAGSTSGGSGGAAVPDYNSIGSNAPVSYKYNRWFVNERHEFVATEAVVEDPDVVQQRRTALPEPTAEDTWKKPHSPFFEPLVPFIRVMDYPKDADVKYLKPTNIPRWKDFMARSKPMIPRTWY
jgi:hypothetical protein